MDVLCRPFVDMENIGASARVPQATFQSLQAVHQWDFAIFSARPFCYFMCFGGESHAEYVLHVFGFYFCRYSVAETSELPD